MNEEYHKAIKLQHATHIIADFGNTTYLSRNASIAKKGTPSVDPLPPSPLEDPAEPTIAHAHAGGRKLLVHGSLVLAVAPVLIAFTPAMAPPAMI